MMISNDRFVLGTCFLSSLLGYVRGNALVQVPRDYGEMPLSAISSSLHINAFFQESMQTPSEDPDGPLTQPLVPVPALITDPPVLSSAPITEPPDSLASPAILTGVASGLRQYVDPLSLIPSSTPGCDTSRCLAIYPVSCPNIKSFTGSN